MVQERLHGGHPLVLACLHLRLGPVDGVNLWSRRDQRAKEVVTRPAVVGEELIVLDVVHEFAVPLAR